MRQRRSHVAGRPTKLLRRQWRIRVANVDLDDGRQRAAGQKRRPSPSPSQPPEPDAFAGVMRHPAGAKLNSNLLLVHFIIFERRSADATTSQLPPAHATCKCHANERLIAPSCVYLERGVKTDLRFAALPPHSSTSFQASTTITPNSNKLPRQWRHTRRQRRRPHSQCTRANSSTKSSSSSSSSSNANREATIKWITC